MFSSFEMVLLLCTVLFYCYETKNKIEIDDRLIIVWYFSDGIHLIYQHQQVLKSLRERKPK